MSNFSKLCELLGHLGPKAQENQCGFGNGIRSMAADPKKHMFVRFLQRCLKTEFARDRIIPAICDSEDTGSCLARLASPFGCFSVTPTAANL